MTSLRSLFGPSKDEAWKQLSDRIHATFVEGGPLLGSKVVAKVDEWTITLDTHQLPATYDHIPYTRMRAPYINKDGFRFKIYREGLFSELEKVFGLQDIKVGYPEFDDNYIIQGNDEKKVKSLFSNPKIRELIQAQPPVYFEIKDDDGWFHEDFPESDDELYFLIDEEIKDIERLKSLYDLFAATLHHLCHIGSAYENDPQIEL